MSELLGWENLGDPSLDVLQGDVESWGDDSALVDSSEELDDDLVRSVVIDQLELSDVSVLLHLLQELDEDLGGWSEEDLSQSLSLGVDDGVEGVGKDVDSHLAFSEEFIITKSSARFAELQQDFLPTQKTVQLNPSYYFNYFCSIL